MVFLGIGNPLKGDDAVGIYFVKRLKNDIEKEKSYLLNTVDFFVAGNDPFSFIFKIKNKRYDKVVLVDACIFEGNPGEVKIFSSDDIRSFNFVMTTHNYDLRLFLNMIEREGVDVIFIGIKPKFLEERETLSQEVENSYQVFKKIALSLIS